MDWAFNTQSDLWLFPRGISRQGGLTANSFNWTSQYGSVVVSAYNGFSADGLNEKGLAANLLYLGEAKYPPAEGDLRPTMVIGAWVQWALDNFATTAEAVEAHRKDAFRMVPVLSPEGKPGTVHLSISDPSGDSAIFEYVDGKLVIHHGRQYQVMTNSPVYDEQLALNTYWKQIGGTVMLPGTHRAADRFARASFYINASTQTADTREAVATVFSVIRNTSVPRGISAPDAPNIAPTIWRTVSDQKNLVYYFEDTTSPSPVWVKFATLDFKEGSGVRKLTLFGNADLGGDQTANFKKAEPFKFILPH
jgi:choloylglycine hydrolase